MTSDERDELLLGLKADMNWVIKGLNNHLQHHWLITLTACAAAGTAIGALVVVLVQRGIGG